MRTDLRPRHREAAMVTDQALAKAVIDQPGVADSAGKAMPAGPAQGQRRVAGGFEEQQRLSPPLHRYSDLLGERRREEAPARRRCAAHVDRLDMRHVLAAEPRRQNHALITALARIDFGFDRWRR